MEVSRLKIEVPMREAEGLLRSMDICWRRQWHPTPVFRPGEFNRLYSPWGREGSDTTDFHFHFFWQ